MAQAVNFVVDGGGLLDVGIRLGHIGFGLVVVVVADEKVDGVVGEKRAELLAQLRRKRLVVRDDERRALHSGDDRRHREGLARARCPQKRLEPIPALETFHQLRDGLGLVAARFERRAESEHTP